jgi:hypothetical protein
MDKLFDILKLLSWFSNILEARSPGSNQGLLDEPSQISKLIETLPILASDLNNISQSLQGLEVIQSSLNLNDLNDLKNGKNIFQLLNTLKAFAPIISKANEAMSAFWKKHFSIVSRSGYAQVLFDIQKGIEALDGLVQFLVKNINGSELF